MCNTPKSVTLQTAILLTVKSFAEQGKKFSVHDVTKTLRDQANNGEIEIPEVEDLTGQDGYRFNIKHPQVKALFNQMRDNGVFATDFNLNSRFTGMYFEYEASPINQVSNPTPAFTPAPANIFSPTNPSVTPVAPVAAPFTPTSTVSAPIISDSEINNRVKTYLANCTNRNYRPSIRQVQSAIKRDYSTGCSCERLKNMILDMGYAVVDNPDAISKSQVVTV